MAIAQDGVEQERLPPSRTPGAVLRRAVVVMMLSAVMMLSVVIFLSAVSCRFSYDLNQRKEALSWNQPPESTDGSWNVALGEAILPVFFDDGTKYSAGFDDTTFRNLPMGVDQSTVENWLGPPISTKTFPDGNVCWYYSEAGDSSENYFIRVLIFDSSGVLMARRTRFYVD